MPIGTHVEYDKYLLNLVKDEEKACFYLRDASLNQVARDYNKHLNQPDEMFYGACLLIKLTSYPLDYLTRPQLAIAYKLFLFAGKRIWGDSAFTTHHKTRIVKNDFPYAFEWFDDLHCRLKHGCSLAERKKKLQRGIR